ncbi:aryl hydrocarbon receptor nuclear translocator-like 1b [Micropterus dolomieu]|uniref:aryl hydrocarbon receptor nuclear translocator-like 1b n=1 Tax=Micropterus dolomieu TaxID=147949 RepID=UPI001E8E802A|nr:aryl hydrocarbon receptor nuclear translocator-like 1b [Micropterus dolomieu]
MDSSSTMSSFMSSRSNNLINSFTGTTSRNFSRKRKGSSTVYPYPSYFYRDCGDQQGCNKNARRTHSQTEKRRRDKMNRFIDELASLVPTCNTKSRKLDKLSVLRMAVQHMKTLRGSGGNCYTEVNHKPAFLSDEELQLLLRRAADGFLFAIDCDRGKILFVSDSVYKILNYSQNDLIGQSLFEYLHPKDIAKVKEQLSSVVTIPQEKIIHAKSGPFLKTDINPSSLRLCSGVRRSFFCRMKCNGNIENEDFPSSCSKNNADHNGFCTIHSTGYLKGWSPTEVDLDENNEPDNDVLCNLSCLVAVGRLHPHTVSQPVQNHVKVKPMEFVSRHAIDGKFLFVDQRATAILSYLPHELLGTSFYEYIHEDDIAHLAESHRQVLQMREKINTNCYKLKIKDGSFITLTSHWFSFMNPWTKEVEYIVATNTVVIPSGTRPERTHHQPAAPKNTMATVLMSGDGEGRPVLQTGPGIHGSTRAGARKIGRMIAKELLEMQRMDMRTVYPEAQKVFEEAASPVVSVPLEVATSSEAEEDVFEGLETAQEVYAEYSGL